METSEKSVVFVTRDRKSYMNCGLSKQDGDVLITSLKDNWSDAALELSIISGGCEFKIMDKSKDLAGNLTI